jgi:hypothetical protein
MTMDVDQNLSETGLGIVGGYLVGGEAVHGCRTCHQSAMTDGRWQRREELKLTRQHQHGILL